MIGAQFDAPKHQPYYTNNKSATAVPPLKPQPPYRVHDELMTKPVTVDVVAATKEKIGDNCKELTDSVDVGGSVTKTKGVACQNPAGEWIIQ